MTSVQRSCATTTSPWPRSPCACGSLRGGSKLNWPTIDVGRPHSVGSSIMHRIGRTPVWTEAQYLALRDALKAESAESQDSSSSNAAGAGISTVLLSRRDAESASERVLTLKRCRRSGQKQMPNGIGSRRKSEANSAVKRGQVLTFRSPQNST